MIKILNNKYEQMGRQKFLTTASILCLISDITNLAYINLYWLKNKLTREFLGLSFAMQGVDINHFTDYQIDQYKTLLANSMGIVFALFLAYHLIVYFKMARNKLWAKKYVFGYSLTGAVLTIFELPGLFSDHVIWAIIMLMTTFIYIYSFMGIKFFKKQEQ